MRIKKSQNLFLALLIGTGIISGCSTPGNITDKINNNTSNNSTVAASMINISDLESAKVDLASLHDDENAFDDSEALMDNSFSIKSEENDKNREENLEENDKNREYRKPIPPMYRDGRPMTMVPMLRKMKRDDFEKFENENEKQLMNEFRKVRPRAIPKDQDNILAQASTLSSAIKVNDDGTVTIDPLKLKEEVKKVLEARKKELEKRLSTIKESLSKFKEVSKEKVNKLKRKNNIVRNTDKVVTENSDGTVSETMTVKFENTKQGITRENTVVRTLKDGKLIALDHSLKVTTKNYTRISSRIVTFNEDGSKLVKTSSVTEWKNGRKVERNEERLVSANGSASGKGTITVTNKDGKVKTYNLSVSKTLRGETSSTIKDDETKQEVQIVQDEQSTVEVVTSESGKTEQQEVDLEKVVTEV